MGKGTFLQGPGLGAGTAVGLGSMKKQQVGDRRRAVQHCLPAAVGQCCVSDARLWLGPGLSTRHAGWLTARQCCALLDTPASGQFRHRRRLQLALQGRLLLHRIGTRRVRCGGSR